MTALEDVAGWDRATMIENAVQLAHLGFGIVRVCHPLDPGAEWPCSEGVGHRDRHTGASCSAPGKRPIGDRWQEQAERDPERVRTMMGNPGNRSYGIVPPPGAVILDVDGEAPTRLAELTATLGPLPQTRKHRSGNGWHLFYAWPPGVPDPGGALFGIVTRRAPGGMVIGPGSVHAGTGRLYAVERDGPILELPEAWARAAASWSDRHHAAQDRAAPGSGDWKVTAGARHDFLKRQSARLRNTGLRGAALADALLALNAERCDPPKPEAEVRDLAAYFERRKDAPHGVVLTSGAPDGEAARVDAWPVPEDRADAVLSLSRSRAIVDDLITAGRIVVLSGEEGTGKSYLACEAGVRIAAAGGSLAGTWPVVGEGGVLYLSEMHEDDDHEREDAVLASLGVQRAALRGRYFRLPLMTAAGDTPALMSAEWRAWIAGWMREHGVVLLIVDTATGATLIKPWGEEIQAVYRSLRLMLEDCPDLAILLLLHMRKPSGKGERGISSVLGEWGRWCDVVLMMENDGTSLERVKLTARKRVRNQRRIIATKRGGLLVDPVDTDAAGPKVPTERVLAAITAEPGLSYAELGKRLDVSKDTAARYVKALAGRVDAYPTGERGAYRVYLTAAPPQTAARADAAVPEADRTDDRRTAARTYIGAAVRAAVVTPDAVVAAPVPEEVPSAEDGRGTRSLDHCDCGAAKVTIPGTDRAVCTNPECRPRRICPSCQHAHPVRTSCADCPACRTASDDDPPWPTSAPAGSDPVEVSV